MKVSSKINLFECNFGYKNFLIKIKKKKKNYTSNIRQLCLGKDRLILVKYWLNLTKVEIE